ncbi:MAG: metallophosphoesterase [Shewanella sp.]|nr:metallophosphoesterase [Shewanella sp.]
MYPQNTLDSDYQIRRINSETTLKKTIKFAAVSLLLTCHIGLAGADEAQQASAQELIYDGPYLFEQAKTQQSQQAYWICASELQATPVIDNELKRPNACADLPEPRLNPKAREITANTFTDVSKIVALSDVHGQYHVLITLLKNHKIIDEHNNWAYGNGHMVMTGDMFDRGHQVNEVLWFMYKLDKQASDAGGKLHLLMGNHEQMVMRGDLRYVNERYQTAEKLLERSYDELYDSSSEIGQWLRSKHTIVKVNHTLFLHGGISGEWVDRELTLDKANQIYRANIDKSKPELKRDDRLNFLFLGNGPTWFRGYFEDDYQESEIDRVLAYFDVKHIVVGHTSQTRVLGLFSNKVLAVDSSIKNGQSGELLFITPNAGQDTLTRGLYDGSRVTL